MDNELKQEKKMAVKSLIDKGKKDGSLTYEQIGEALSEMELDKEQIENIYDTFAQLGIDILDENISEINKIVAIVKSGKTLEGKNYTTGRLEEEK